MNPLKMINAFDASQAQGLPAEDLALIARREKLLGPAYRLFYQRPLHLVRGEGVWLYDASGQRYLDAYNNVVCVGHCHPQVVQALVRQASTLNTHTRYLHQGLLDYAQRLLATLEGGLDRIMFTCTGSEANDLALRVAQSYTGGTGVIVTSLAYHGVTQATSACSPSLGDSVAPGTHVRTVRAPDAYHSGFADVGARLRDDLCLAIADMRARGIRPAAWLFDSLLTSDGIYPNPAGFLAPAVQAAREAGLVVIADEVQPGFGRTGAGMWGYTRHGLQPDIVTMGKPMGNGHPMAAMATRSGLLDNFGRESRYFNTFGGNTVSAAVGMAVLDVLEQEQLIENSRVVGDYLARSLRQLAAVHPWIGDVRHAGLFIGLELVHERDAQRPAAQQTTHLVNAMRSKGVLISASGPRANVLKIRPPLVFGREHADLFVQTLDACLRELPLLSE